MIFPCEFCTGYSVVGPVVNFAVLAKLTSCIKSANKCIRVFAINVFRDWLQYDFGNDEISFVGFHTMGRL